MLALQDKALTVMNNALYLFFVSLDLMAGKLGDLHLNCMVVDRTVKYTVYTHRARTLEVHASPFASRHNGHSVEFKFQFFGLAPPSLRGPDLNILRFLCRLYQIFTDLIRPAS